MRPLTLTLAGFRSHQRPLEISFEGRRLFAIVGPTGAGKSSILDGMSYALYGRTPGEERETTRLICSRSDAAHIRLSFSIDGEGFEVTRVLRPGGDSEHVLVAAASGDRVIGERAVTKRVEELLGLDFKGFCRSVLLAQGRFSQFLQATPKERGQILKGIFRLDEIDELRGAAKTTRDSLELEVQRLTGARSEIPDDAPKLMESLAAEMRTAEARAAVLSEAIPEERRLQEHVRTASDDIARIEEELGRRESWAALVPGPEELAALTAEQAGLAPRVTAAEGAVAAAEAALAAAATDLTALEGELGSEKDLVAARTRAEGLPALRSSIDELTTSIAAQRGAVSAGEKHLDELERAHAEAGAALEAARSRRSDVETEHRAHALRDVLKPGERCPVCEQTIDTIPTGPAPVALTAVKRDEKSAAAAEKEATAVVASAAAALEGARSRVVAAEEVLERRRHELTELDEAVRALVGDAVDPIAEIEARLGRFDAAAAHLSAVTASRDAAHQELASLGQERRDLERRLREMTARLTRVADQIGIEPPAVDTDAEELARRASSIGDEIEATLRSEREKIDAARALVAEANEVLGTLRARLALDEAASIESALAEARTAAGVAASRIHDLEAKIARAGEIDRDLRKVKKRRSLFAQLATDLADHKFVSFLLEERTRLLMELASARLLEMTARYRLAVDRDQQMEVVDELDAERRRSIATLSGGETFLASLALALALAELVTREGGRLQCFFLDEGFGSLDPESLDLALDGIERIVTEDRVIGLVSHVAALAERVDDRIVLEKGADSMSVLASGGSMAI